MKLAIPSETTDGLESVRSGHFGHTPYFTIVTYDDDMNMTDVEVVQNVEHGPNGCGGVIDYVLTLGIDGILTVGMGMPPLMRFTQAGITVYSDTVTPIVGDAAKMFAAGKVALMDPRNACAH